MNILFFSHSDPYGILNMASKAINKYSEHESRVVTITETQNFDSDISLYRDMWGGFITQPPSYWGGVFRSLIDWSDIVVIGFGMAGKDDAGNPVNDLDIRLDDVPMYDILKKSNKKVIGLLTGSSLTRVKYNFYVKLCKDNGWPLCTYQPEITFLVKDKYACQYLPIILDTYHPRYRNSVFDFIDEQSFSVDRITVSHSWMSSGREESDNVLSTIELLNADEVKFQPIIIQQCGFYDALMMKKSTHIGCDFELNQYTYSGLNSFENSLLGLINITYIDDKSRQLVENTVGCSLPWHIVKTNDELKEQLILLYNNKDKFYDEMILNRDFGLTNLEDAKLVKYWIKYFEECYGT